MAINMARGWPFEGAIIDNFPQAAGANIVEGMACKLNSSGELVKADGTQYEVAWVAYDCYTATDVRAGKKLPVALNGVVQTTEYVAGSYPPGTQVQISAVAGQEGLIIPHAGGTAPTYGWVLRGEVTFDGTTYLEIIKVVPNGTAQ